MAASSDNQIEKVAKSLNIQLKPEQFEILQCLVDRRDCMAVLPTGFGKSIPYQIFSLVLEGLGRDGKVLVCCPLLSLMSDQVARANAIRGVTAAFIGKDSDTDKAIVDGKVDIIYGSPESLLGEWREKLLGFGVSAIVVDEFHLISTWGQDDEQAHKKAFRKWFGEVGELRSLFPDASVLALSATCTLKIQKRVIKALSLRAGYKFINKSPDKRNIKFVIKKVSNDTEMAMTWLVDALSELGEAFPRTIMYCKSIKDVAKIYDYLHDELPSELHHTFSMYHSETEDSIKDVVLASLRDTESTRRLIISTNALGMGIDCRCLSNIILFGPPKSMPEIIQEAGRAGRDGQQAVAVIMCNSHQVNHCDDDVKQLIRKQECRRISSLEPFIMADELQKVKTGDCSCCDICKTKCECGNCVFQPIENLLSGNIQEDDYEELECLELDDN